MPRERIQQSLRTLSLRKFKISLGWNNISESGENTMPTKIPRREFYSTLQDILQRVWCRNALVNCRSMRQEKWSVGLFRQSSQELKGREHSEHFSNTFWGKRWCDICLTTETGSQSSLSWHFGTLKCVNWASLRMYWLVVSSNSSPLQSKVYRSIPESSDRETIF